MCSAAGKIYFNRDVITEVKLLFLEKSGRMKFIIRINSLGDKIVYRALIPYVINKQVRVTSNPLAAEPEDETLDLATSFDNPHHVELPSGPRSSSSASAPIDSTTYCKRDRHHRGFVSRSSARSTSHLRDKLVSFSGNSYYILGCVSFFL